MARQAQDPISTMPPNGMQSLTAVMVHSVEFVATPKAAASVPATIPAAINNAFHGVAGFAGCMLMISDQEARLITVLTFWSGEDRLKRCNSNAGWIYKLIAPHLDHCLRVQTLAAHVPLWLKIEGEAAASLEHSDNWQIAVDIDKVCAG